MERYTMSVDWKTQQSKDTSPSQNWYKDLIYYILKSQQDFGDIEKIWNLNGKLRKKNGWNMVWKRRIKVKEFLFN